MKNKRLVIILGFLAVLAIGAIIYSSLSSQIRTFYKNFQKGLDIFSGKT